MEIGTIFQIPEEKLKINFFKSKSECRSTASAVEQKKSSLPRLGVLHDVINIRADDGKTSGILRRFKVIFYLGGNFLINRSRILSPSPRLPPLVHTECVQPQFITERKIIDNNHKTECAILCRSELSLTLTIGHFR